MRIHNGVWSKVCLVTHLTGDQEDRSCDGVTPLTAYKVLCDV